MAEAETEKKDLWGKIKLGLLLAAGILLLLFLIANLKTWKLSLWWVTSMEGPGTFFIFLFLLVGFIAGFIACFYWLRKQKVDAALNAFSDKGGRKKPQEAGTKGKPPADEKGAESEGGD